MFDVPWIKLLRKTLDSHGLAQVGIIAADQSTDIWNIGDPLNRDADLKNAVYAVGVHYPGCSGDPNHGNPPYSSAAAKAVLNCGKPIWSSEDGPWRGDWVGACTLAKTFNRNCIAGRMCKTIIWSLISSY